MPFKPIDAPKSCLRRARRFLALAEHDLPDSKAKNDLRRMAVVMTIAAIDSYMHALVVREVSGVRGVALPKALEKLDISFGELTSLADSTINAQRQNATSRPWVQVKNVLHKRLLKQTFQSSKQIAEALAMVGVDKCWKKIASELGGAADKHTKRLDRLVLRRNQIVHEGDLARKSRPQQLAFNPIKHRTVERDVEWMDELVTAIDAVVTNGKQP